MTIAEQLTHDLEQVLSGDPWYGSSVYSILDSVSFEAAFEKPPGTAHNIAAIVLHMLAWTEEVLDRLNGLSAQLPSSGDWPEAGMPDEQKWHNYVNDLKLLNVNLLAVIKDYPDEQWEQAVKDDRKPPLGTGVSFEALVKGLIQHNIYHAAQVSLLLRMIQTSA